MSWMESSIVLIKGKCCFSGCNFNKYVTEWLVSLTLYITNSTNLYDENLIRKKLEKKPSLLKYCLKI